MQADFLGSILNKRSLFYVQMPVKEELDRAVPPHELLDVSVTKAKAELATRGGLAGRQLPSSKKALSSSGSVSSINLFIRFTHFMYRQHTVDNKLSK